MSLLEALVSVQKPFKRQHGTRVMSITIMLLDPSNSSPPLFTFEAKFPEEKEILRRDMGTILHRSLSPPTNYFFSLTN